MPAPLLATKLTIPPSRQRVVLRLRLAERLDEGLGAGSRLTLVSAPAGFGKTTLVREWVAGCGRPAAWLSPDDVAALEARTEGWIAGLQLAALSVRASPDAAADDANPTATGAGTSGAVEP